MDLTKLRRRATLIFTIMATVQACVLLLVVYIAGDTERLPAVLSRTRWLWFLPVPLLVPAFYFAHARRITVALKHVHATVPRQRGLAACILSGNLANAALPGMAGEVVLAYLASRFHSVPMPTMLASSAYSKAVGLATNVSLAFLGLLLMPSDRQGIGGEFNLPLLFKTAVGMLLAVLILALVFPRLLHVVANLIRKLFRVARMPEQASKWRVLAAKVADGLDRTAEHFAALRKAGPATAAKVVGATLLINVVFSCIFLLGFMAVGYYPAFYQVLLFNSMLMVVFIATMIFLGALGTMELTAITYWSQVTGLGASEIVVVLAAVRLWQFVEMASALFVFCRYLSKLSAQDAKALFERKGPPT